jgi:hypothetical protein
MGGHNNNLVDIYVGTGYSADQGVAERGSDWRIFGGRDDSRDHF